MNKITKRTIKVYAILAHVSQFSDFCSSKAVRLGAMAGPCALIDKTALKPLVAVWRKPRPVAKRNNPRPLMVRTQVALLVVDASGGVLDWRSVQNEYDGFSGPNLSTCLGAQIVGRMTDRRLRGVAFEVARDAELIIGRQDEIAVVQCLEFENSAPQSEE